MSFSERSGLVPARALQRGAMDGRLRNGLWNAIDALLERMGVMNLFSPMERRACSPADALLEQIWIDFLGARRDEFGVGHPAALVLREWFSQAKWHRAYDLIEYVARHADDETFASECNAVLERELSAYRLVRGKLIDLTAAEQIDAINAAVEATSEIEPVNDHLRTALARLADRSEPDYRNAVKEAISAVECLTKLIAGKKFTLSEALTAIRTRKLIDLHPTLNDAWQKIYAYAGDEGGVRHSLKGVSNVDLPEAMYMVVTCSAFVSYLVQLANRAGIDLVQR